MKKTFLIAPLVCCILFFISCSGGGETESTEAEPVKVEETFSKKTQPREGEVVKEEALTIIEPELTELEKQILFVREKYGIITAGVSSNSYDTLSFRKDTEAGVIVYERYMEGEELRLVTILDAHQHGGDKMSYYFWDNHVIFKFDEKSYWVGNTDEMSERRSYYKDGALIHCLTRSIESTGGYDKVKKELGSVAQEKRDCSGLEDETLVNHISNLTEETISEFIGIETM